MASYLRPRRGKKATATSQAITLKRGEVFFEVPTGGVGTGIGKIKMGDGSTTYSSLPYFASTEDDTVAFTNVTATTASSNNSTYLSDFAPTATLKTNFNKIKQLLYNLNGQVTSLNNDFANFQTGVSTIVAAINAKAGSNHAATAAPSAIAATVNNLNLGIVPSGTLEKNANGTYDCTNYASFKVNVPASAVTSGTLEKNANGTYDCTAYKNVTINVPASAVTSGTGSITSNGTHNVTTWQYASVAVPQGASTVSVNCKNHDRFTTFDANTSKTYTLNNSYKYYVVALHYSAWHWVFRAIAIQNGSITGTWSTADHEAYVNMLYLSYSGTTLTMTTDGGLGNGQGAITICQVG